MVGYSHKKEHTIFYDPINFSFRSESKNKKTLQYKSNKYKKTNGHRKCV